MPPPKLNFGQVFVLKARKSWNLRADLVAGLAATYTEHGSTGTSKARKAAEDAVE